jgi:xanthine/uracil permease
LALAGGVIIVIVALMRFGRGVLAQSAVLIALVLGTVAAMFWSMADFGGVGSAAWLGLPKLFLFGTPTFPIAGTISMCLVMLVIFTETTAYLMSTAETLGRQADRKEIARGLAADGVSALAAGVTTSFADTVFAQNVSLIRMTGVTSRRAVCVAGALLVALGVVPKMGEIVASLPGPVIGAVSLVMFATVAGVGIATLAKADLTRNDNLLIVSLAMGIGMIPVVAPKVYDNFPAAVKIIAGGAITSTVVVAFVLNLLFHHLGSTTARKEAVA